MSVIAPDCLNQYKQRTEKQLDLCLQDVNNVSYTLRAAMRYSLLNGGKRIRSALIYAVGKYFDTPYQTLLDDAASAIEMIHAFSLIHDDLPAMDDDDLRRGEPTCHIAFDEATAILAGDALQAHAFSILSRPDAQREQRLKMLNYLANAVGANGMTGGQMIDIQSTGKQLTLDKLVQMHMLKTGKLIHAAVQLGAIASDVDDPVQLEALQHFSQAIGLGFQICDDVLDATVATATAGKATGKDQAQRKVTFVTLLSLEKAQQEAVMSLEKALSALSVFQPEPTELVQLAQYMVERGR